jgi:hypothetical protein
MTMTFPEPASPDDKLLLVYQGTIGWTNDDALDPVDKGIGIAAKTFTVQSQITTPGFAFEWKHGMAYGSVGWNGTFTPQDANGNSWELTVSADPVSGANISNYAWFDLSAGGTGTIEYSITGSGSRDWEFSSISLCLNGADILIIETDNQSAGNYSVPFTVTSGGQLELYVAASVRGDEKMDIKGTIYLP